VLNTDSSSSPSDGLADALADILADILADALVADFLARPPAWALAAGMVDSPGGMDRGASEAA